MHDVDAEVGDHAFGHHRADALDQARAQVALDALDGGGQHGGIGVNLELLAVFRVARPAAAHPQALADLRAQQRPHHRDQVRASAGVDPRDRVPGLRIGESDPLHDAVKDRGVVVSPSFRRHTTIMPVRPGYVLHHRPAGDAALGGRLTRPPVGPRPALLGRMRRTSAGRSAPPARLHDRGMSPLTPPRRPTAAEPWRAPSGPSKPSAAQAGRHLGDAPVGALVDRHVGQHARPPRRTARRRPLRSLRTRANPARVRGTRCRCPCCRPRSDGPSRPLPTGTPPGTSAPPGKLAPNEPGASRPAATGPDGLVSPARTSDLEFPLIQSSHGAAVSGQKRRQR